MEWDGERWGNNIHWRRIGSLRYVDVTLKARLWNVHPSPRCLRMMCETGAGSGALTLLLRMKVSVLISRLFFFRRLHWLFRGSEEGWAQWQGEERGGGDCDICASLHHWDVGLGTAARWEKPAWMSLKLVSCSNSSCCRAVLPWLLSLHAFLFPSRVTNTTLTAEGFVTPKCRRDESDFTSLFIGRSGHAEVGLFCWHVRCGNWNDSLTSAGPRGYFYPAVWS